jgi:ribose 5-phosphate isomerase A
MGNLIKGRGGALFLEKLVMKSTGHRIIVVDESKRVDTLGRSFPVPIEIVPGALMHVIWALEALGARDISLRPARSKDGPVITELGNLLLDVRFESLGGELEGQIKKITGVVESGLFWGYEPEILSP